MLKIIIEDAPGQVGENASFRIEFSAGSKPAASEAYSNGAIVPIGPWHSDRPKALRDIQTGQGRIDSDAVVRLKSFPQQLLAEFHGLFDDGDRQSVTDVRAISRSPAGRDVLENFSCYVSEAYDCSINVPGRRRMALFAVKEGNLGTVTTNGSDGLRTGLHVDDWSMLPLASRAQAPYRICANFGWRDRFLLFVEIPLDELVTGAVPGYRIWSQDCLRNEFPNGVGASAFAQSFLRSFPSFPISRLRVKPGEAYIAPTDNLIHDGSSVGGMTTDVACHVWVR